MNKKELIELCKKGDKQALSWLYQAYADKMTLEKETFSTLTKSLL